MVNVDGKHSDRFLAEVRFKNQLSEIAAQSLFGGVLVPCRCFRVSGETQQLFPEQSKG